MEDEERKGKQKKEKKEEEGEEEEDVKTIQFIKEVTAILKESDSFNYVFMTDDHVTLSFHKGLGMTIDFDTRYCRIHRNWVLQEGLDLSIYWFNVRQCSEVIMNYLLRFE